MQLDAAKNGRVRSVRPFGDSLEKAMKFVSEPMGQGRPSHHGAKTYSPF